MSLSYGAGTQWFEIIGGTTNTFLEYYVILTYTSTSSTYTIYRNTTLIKSGTWEIVDQTIKFDNLVVLVPVEFGTNLSLTTNYGFKATLSGLIPEIVGEVLIAYRGLNESPQTLTTYFRTHSVTTNTPSTLSRFISIGFTNTNFVTAPNFLNVSTIQPTSGTEVDLLFGEQVKYRRIQRMMDNLTDQLNATPNITSLLS